MDRHQIGQVPGPQAYLLVPPRSIDAPNSAPHRGIRECDVGSANIYLPAESIKAAVQAVLRLNVDTPIKESHTVASEAQAALAAAAPLIVAKYLEDLISQDARRYGVQTDQGDWIAVDRIRSRANALRSLRV